MHDLTLERPAEYGECTVTCECGWTLSRPTAYLALEAHTRHRASPNRPAGLYPASMDRGESFRARVMGGLLLR